MLGKLLKHEFRATTRVMLPVFGALLVLAVLGNLSARVLDSSRSTLLTILGALIMVAFGFAIGAALVMSLVIMIRRFAKNLLGDEGYLMFTLPTGVHSLVWSKIIVSTVWFIGAFIAVMLSALIVSFRVSSVNEFIETLRQAFSHIPANFSLDWTAVGIEMIVAVLLGCIGTCLLFYASISVGCSFDNHKALLSVVFFFVFQFAAQFLATALLAVFGRNVNIDFNFVATQIDPLVHSAMLSVIGSEILYCAVFYVITTLTLKKRLNLA